MNADARNLLYPHICGNPMYKTFLLCALLCYPLFAQAKTSSWNSANVDELIAMHRAHYQRLKDICGPESLTYVCHKLNVDVSFEEIYKLCPPNKKGVSMASLAEAAGDLGLRAVGRRLEFGDLNHVNMPAVLFVGHHHFIVFEGMDGNRAIIIDTGRKQLLNRDALNSIWQGETLLISRPNKTRNYALAGVVVLLGLAAVYLSLKSLVTTSIFGWSRKRRR